MNLAANFLNVYDACKRSRSPQQCRQYVGTVVPTMINTYLASYDACCRAFDAESCRKYFAPEREKIERWKLCAAFGLGLLIGWRVL